MIKLKIQRFGSRHVKQEELFPREALMVCQLK